MHPWQHFFTVVDQAALGACAQAVYLGMWCTWICDWSYIGHSSYFVLSVRVRTNHDDQLIIAVSFVLEIRQVCTEFRRMFLTTVPFCQFTLDICNILSIPYVSDSQSIPLRNPALLFSFSYIYTHPSILEPQTFAFFRATLR